MSRRRKPKGVRSRSRSKPNFTYSGAGCAASSAAADPSRKKKKSAVARSLREGEKSLRQLKAKDTLGRYRSVAHRGSLYLSIKTIAPVDRSPALFLRVQHQLLHAPVEQLRDVEHVLRRAGDLVDPAELLQLLPGFAAHDYDLSVKGQLEHPARERVGGVQHLFRSGRDAHRPRRAGHHRLRPAPRLDLREIRQVADRGARLRIVRHVDRELALERPLAVEHLDAPVAAVRDVDVALRIGGDRVRCVELAGLRALAPPRLEPPAVPVDLGA